MLRISTKIFNFDKKKFGPKISWDQILKAEIARNSLYLSGKLFKWKMFVAIILILQFLIQRWFLQAHL